MNTVWLVVILGLVVLQVSGMCRNPHIFTDDVKLCNNWWLEAMDRSDARDYTRVRRCMIKIIKRCPLILTVGMTAQKEDNGKNRLRIRFDATHNSLRTRNFYVVYKSKKLCVEGRGMKKADFCSFFKQVHDLIDWSEMEKEQCQILMSHMECDSNK